MKIRTRFAPSPTGYLHVGSARTALYSWLFARHLGGKFILRIEDTDLERSTPLAIKAIIEGMNWLNLDWDEGPYFQTQRFSRYNTIIERMLLMHTAYKCYCSKERLQILRNKQIDQGKKPRYDGLCRDSCTKRNFDEPYVVRFKNPQNGYVMFNDLIRGPIEFSNQELDDLIIRRTNGSPTYNFCVVVDDFDMAITHVIRGEDHINNTPRQINILKVLGAPLPNYAHVSMILGDDGKKLSKRHGAIGVLQYRDDGFLPEALLNHLVRLGWSYGDQEIFSINEMQQLFSFKAVNKAASKFNTKKLLWFNNYYINQLPPYYVANHLSWNIKKQVINTNNNLQLIQLVKLLGIRCKTLKEMILNYRYFYEDFSTFDSDIARKYLCLAVVPILKMVHTKLKIIQNWTITSIYNAIKQTSEELDVKISDINMLIRIVVANTEHTPSIDVTVHTIGKSRSLIRLEQALEFIVRN